MDKQVIQCTSCQKSIRATIKSSSYNAKCPICGQVLSIPASNPSELNEVDEVLAAHREDLRPNAIVPPPVAVVQAQSITKPIEKRRGTVTISRWSLVAMIVLGPLLGALVALVSTGALQPVRTQIAHAAKAIPFVAPVADLIVEPEKKAVRKWLQENHPNPETIEEIAWHIGRLDGFQKYGSSQSSEEAHYAMRMSGEKYAWLKMRHLEGISRSVDERYYVLNEDGRVACEFHYIGSYDNPNEKRAKPDPNKIDPAVAELDRIRGEVAEAQARAGNGN